MMRYTDSIEWPSGMGYTECTTEYADAINNRDFALNAFEALNPKDDGYTAAYETWQRAEAVIDRLYANGHLGKPHRYAT